MKKIGLVFLSISGVAMLAGCKNNPISSKEYFVSFVADGAYETIPTQRVLEGKYADEPKRPTRDGYTFKQWCSDSDLTKPFDFKKDKIIRDTTLYADWGNIKKYEVHFFIDGEEQTALTQSVSYGQLVTRPDTPTKDYHDFDGWYMNQECVGQTYTFDSPLIDLYKPLYLYGKFVPTPGAIKVTYIANGGTITGEDYKYVGYGDSIAKAPIASKEDYTCAGWYTDNGTFSKQFIFGTTPVTEPISLYAKWEQTTFHIKWLNYDGTPLLDSEVEKGQPVVYKGKTPQKFGNYFTDYSFSGWSPEPESAATKDQIHVAQYEEKMMNDVFCLEANVQGKEDRTVSITLVGDGQAEVDWGDQVTEVVSYANKIAISHTYEQDGAYEIRVNGDTTGIDQIDPNKGASFITQASLNDSLYTMIDPRAFYKCTSLTSVNIPEAVSTINSEAFKECESLPSITLPLSITEIKASAFESCKMLSKVYIANDVALITGAELMFDDCASNLVIYVPDNLLAAYESDSNWNGYNIKGYSIR